MLARGPRQSIKSYNGYFVNGYKFETRLVEDRCVTQNSGVSTINGQGNIYCGVVEDILEIAFSDEMIMHIFKCKWYENANDPRPKKNNFYFTFIKITNTIWDEEPFTYPYQSQQIFYSSDSKNGNFKIVCKWKPNETYEVGEDFFYEEEHEGERGSRKGETYMPFHCNLVKSGPSVKIELQLSEYHTTYGEIPCIRKELGRGIAMRKKLLKLLVKPNKNKCQRGNLIDNRYFLYFYFYFSLFFMFFIRIIEWYYISNN